MNKLGSEHRLRRLSSAAAWTVSVGALMLAAAGPGLTQEIGDFDLLIHDARRGGTIALTDTPGYGEFNAAFSPDGKTIIHEVVDGSFSSPTYLALTDVATGITVPLPGGEGGNDAVYSPNGRHIAFDPYNIGEVGIYLMPPAGGEWTLVRPFGLAPTWSNNSHRLAFLDVTDGSIRSVDIRTGEEINLGEVGAYGDFPDWSPDGKWIAYQTWDEQLKAVRVNEQGEPLGEPIIVTFGLWSDLSPSWSNDSKTIVFMSSRETGLFDLWTLNIDEVEAPPACGLDDSGNDPAEAYGVPVFLRGSMNGWVADDASMFVNQGDDLYEVEVLLPKDYSIFKVASEDWATVDFAPPALVELDVPQVMVGPAAPNGVIAVAESGCYRFSMDVTNLAAPVLNVTTVVTGPIGAPATRLTGAPGTHDVDPAYSNNGRFVVYSGVIEP